MLGTIMPNSLLEAFLYWLHDQPFNAKSDEDILEDVQTFVEICKR